MLKVYMTKFKKTSYSFIYYCTGCNTTQGFSSNPYKDFVVNNNNVKICQQNEATSVCKGCKP